jgi:hypothetical protein
MTGDSGNLNDRSDALREARMAERLEKLRTSLDHMRNDPQEEAWIDELIAESEAQPGQDPADRIAELREIVAGVQEQLDDLQVPNAEPVPAARAQAPAHRRIQGLWIPIAVLAMVAAFAGFTIAVSTIFGHSSTGWAASLIAASATVIGGLAGFMSSTIRSTREQRRDERERHAELVRQASLSLIREATELRAQVADTADYSGPGMESRLSAVRRRAGGVQLAAANIAMLGPGALAENADLVATAANNLAASMERNIDVRYGTALAMPDFSEFDAYIASWRAIAVEYSAVR